MGGVFGSRQFNSIAVQGMTGDYRHARCRASRGSLKVQWFIDARQSTMDHLTLKLTNCSYGVAEAEYQRRFAEKKQ